MKNQLLSFTLALPLFLLMGSTFSPVVATMPEKEFTCPSTNTGSWTITYSPGPLVHSGATVTITASFNNGWCPSAGDITVTKTAGVYVSASPSNQVSNAIPPGVDTFVVGTMVLTNISDPLINEVNARMVATVNGGHSITNPTTMLTVDNGL